MRIELKEPIGRVPAALEEFGLTLEQDGSRLVYSYDTRASRTGIVRLLSAVAQAGITVADVETRQSSLEDIFVGLVSEKESA
jgi:ABC-2 type transport system ATP-binding protein